MKKEISPRTSTLAYLLTLLLLLFFSGSAAQAQNKVKVLKLEQNHYALGKFVIWLSADSLKMENLTHDTHILARNGSVCMFSKKRELKHNRTLQDFLTKGSSANWLYSEKLLQMPFFPARQGIYAKTSARMLISPSNPHLVSRLLQNGKPVDLEKRAMATCWVKEEPGYWKDGMHVITAFYRLPRFDGLILYCSYLTIDDTNFWERSVNKEDRKARESSPVRKTYLQTSSIQELFVDKSLFSLPGNYKLAGHEDQVYMSPQLTSDIETMFMGQP